MKYLCMIFFDEKKLDALSKPEHEALVNESLAYDDELRSRGLSSLCRCHGPAVATGQRESSSGPTRLDQRDRRRRGDDGTSDRDILWGDGHGRVRCRERRTRSIARR